MPRTTIIEIWNNEADIGKGERGLSKQNYNIPFLYAIYNLAPHALEYVYSIYFINVCVAGVLLIFYNDKLYQKEKYSKITKQLCLS